MKIDQSERQNLGTKMLKTDQHLLTCLRFFLRQMLSASTLAKNNFFTLNNGYIVETLQYRREE